ncbi:hypothetical protein KI387_044533, partial [Taxus chinensis]
MNHCIDWLMRRVHEDFFYFAGCRVRITTTLISIVIGLKGTGVDLNSDLIDKATILETRKELGYTKDPRGMDIDKLKKYPIIKAVTHLVTKLNDQERWSQVNTMWLHITKKMSQGVIYNISSYIVETIIEESCIGDKISFGVVLLSLVFMEIRVPDGPKEKIWEYPMENKSLAERFGKYFVQRINEWTIKVEGGEV